jgi:hypothetical protein
MFESNIEHRDGERSQPALQRAEVHYIFFRGQKGIRPNFCTHILEAFDVVFVVRVVIAKSQFRCRRYPGCSHLGEKLLRPCDAAEEDRGDHVRRKQPVVKVFGGHEHKVEVSSERAVLKTIVEDVQLLLKFLLGYKTRFIPALSDNDGNTQSACDQKRFISKVGGSSFRLDHQNTLCFSAIAARENVEADGAILEQLTECDHKRRLPRTTGGQIPNADDGALKATRREYFGVIQNVAEGADGTVESGEGIHAESLAWRFAIS